MVSCNAVVFSNVKIYESAWIYGRAIVCENAKVFGNAKVHGDAKVCGYARVCDNVTVYGNVCVCDNAVLCNYVQVYGEAQICGDAVLITDLDYIVFKNWWSSGRYFTWTRSNDMWRVGCFYGKGKQLIERAYNDSEISGREYERIVKYVEAVMKDGKR